MSNLGQATAKCRTCGAPIVWVRTTNDKRMPLDVEPAPNGNIRMVDGVAVYASKDAPVEPGEKLYLSHFVTCPDRDQHRKPPNRPDAT